MKEDKIEIFIQSTEMKCYFKTTSSNMNNLFIWQEENHLLFDSWRFRLISTEIESDFCLIVDSVKFVFMI
jgi:hypothetical protein